MAVRILNFIKEKHPLTLIIANAYWLPMLANTADVDKALDDFQKSGMDVLRIWGFADLTGDPGSQTAFQVS